MYPAPDPTEAVLRDNVRLYVDFRDVESSQIHDYIRQLKGLVRNVAAFSYLMIDARERARVLKAIRDLQLDDYVYLDLDPDHRLDELKIDMIFTTSQRVHLYSNIGSLVSGRVGKSAQVINADQISTKALLEIVRDVYFPSILQ